MLKRLALAVAIVAMLHAAFVWGYMPVRARRLSAKYAAFRAGYVDDGVRDGPVILFMHRPPEAWYSWRYVLPLVDRIGGTCCYSTNIFTAIMARDWAQATKRGGRRSLRI